MSKVLVLDTRKRPINPVHPGRARIMLSTGKAAVYRRYPFTIIMKSVSSEPVEPSRLKIDPGSKFTGIVLVQGETVVFAAEIEHRGHRIRRSLEKRRSLRRSRRYRKTRYRKPRFLNRKRPSGWLPPSLESRVQNVVTWVNRLSKLAPVGAISLELVKFDTQKLQNPEINGVEYQRGELFGYEVKEYLLEKWGRKCAYCGIEGVPLQIEHIHPKSKGGTNRVSNLVLACRACNKQKGNKDVSEFLAGRPEVLKRVLAQAKAPLKDAAAVNATRWALFRRLQCLGLPVETSSGGRTKFNRVTQGYPKAHWIDAACVGESGARIGIPPWIGPIRVKSVGHGSRQKCGTDKYGFPVRHAPKAKTFIGFQTGDLVQAVIPKGKYMGSHIGRIAVRHRPSFKLNGLFDVHPKYMRILHHADGYDYAALPPHG